MGSGSFKGATGAAEPAPCALPGRGPRAAVPALVAGDAPGLPVSTVVPLEGVLGRDLPSPFFFLSFLYPEKTDFHRDLGLAAASSRALGLGLSAGRPSPLGFFSFLFLLGEKRDDLFLLFPLEPSDEVTEPSRPPESEGGDGTSSLVGLCVGVGSSGPLGGTAVALRGAGVLGALGAVATVSISFILLSCRAMASLSAGLRTDFSRARIRSAASSLASAETSGSPRFCGGSPLSGPRPLSWARGCSGQGQREGGVKKGSCRLESSVRSSYVSSTSSAKGISSTLSTNGFGASSGGGRVGSRGVRAHVAGARGSEAASGPARAGFP